MVGLRTAALGLGIIGALGLLAACPRSAVAPTAHQDAAAQAPAAGLRGLGYELSVDGSLTWVDVRLCMHGQPSGRLVPGPGPIAAHTSRMRTAAGEPLPWRDGGYRLAALGEDACIAYRVDLASLEADEAAERLVGRTGDSLLLRPDAWLWRPDPRPADAEVTLRFALPEGMQASVPWPTLAGHPRGTDHATYVLDPTAFRWLSSMAMGNVTLDRFERAGAEIELVILDAPVACPPGGLRRWVEDAVDTVALLFEGRFPRERLQLVVIPVDGGGGGTVYFGMAARGGGAGVQIFLDARARAEALPGGWTTVHELLHHGMPFVEEPWMAEGWVTYYTEIVRTRAGHRSEREGWQALLEGFGRGRRDRAALTLEASSASMHRTRAYQRVYWSGAAIALLIDVEMRLESGGKRTLDDAIRELRRCCGDAHHQWKARALLEHLDGWYGRPLFTRTADAVLGRRELPDVEASLARLGVLVGDDQGLRLDDEHPAAAQRRAIMAPQR
jgi:hypothetical protein